MFREHITEAWQFNERLIMPSVSLAKHMLRYALENIYTDLVKKNISIYIKRPDYFNLHCHCRRYVCRSLVTVSSLLSVRSSVIDRLSSGIRYDCNTTTWAEPREKGRKKIMRARSRPRIWIEINTTIYRRGCKKAVTPIGRSNPIP